MWCEVVGQDAYELSITRLKGISRSDFLEKGKERLQDLGHKLSERMNQEKEGIKVLCKSEDQLEEESKRADNFFLYMKI